MRPCCHQAQANSTTGSITVEVLLRSASTKARSERPYLREVRSPKSEVRRLGSSCKYHRRLKRKNGSESVFFSSEIQATEPRIPGGRQRSSRPARAPGFSTAPARATTTARRQHGAACLRRGSLPGGCPTPATPAKRPHRLAGNPCGTRPTPGPSSPVTSGFRCTTRKSSHRNGPRSAGQYTANTARTTSAAPPASGRQSPLRSAGGFGASVGAGGLDMRSPFLRAQAGAACLSSTCRVLPLVVLGSSRTNSIWRGYL